MLFHFVRKNKTQMVFWWSGSAYRSIKVFEKFKSLNWKNVFWICNVWAVRQLYLEKHNIGHGNSGAPLWKMPIKNERFHLFQMIVRAHRLESSRGEAFYVIQKSCYGQDFMLHDRKTLTKLVNLAIIRKLKLVRIYLTVIIVQSYHHNY